MMVAGPAGCGSLTVSGMQFQAKTQLHSNLAAERIQDKECDIVTESSKENKMMTCLGLCHVCTQLC